MPATNGNSPSLTRNELLSRLAPDQLNQLLPSMELIDLPQRQMLQRRGDAIDFGYFPETAVVSFLVNLEDGGTVEVGMVGKEGFVGASVVLGDEVAAHDAMAQIPGKALRIPGRQLRAAVHSDPALQVHLLRYVHAFQYQVAQTAACNARHDVEQRCARWILTARDRAGANEFSLTHEFLAMMLAVRRAGVTVAAGILEKAGMITNRRGHIKIVDVAGLEEVACECHRLIREEEARLLS